MKILDIDYKIMIPTESEDLATLLENYALDWAEVLSFLSRVAGAQGLVLNNKEVSEIMKRKYE